MKARDHGFSLVEVTLALGVAAVSLLVIFSLLPVGLQINKRSAEQTESADILSAIAADLRATPVTNPRGTAASSPDFGISIPPSGSGGTPTTMFFIGAGQFANSLQSSSRYRVTVTFLPTRGGRSATLAHLRVSWPAAAGTPNAEGAVEMFAAFDRN